MSAAPPSNGAAPPPPSDMRAMAADARRASRILATFDSGRKDAALSAIKRALADPSNRARILAANDLDVADARRAATNGEISEALLNRLKLKNFDGLLDGIDQVTALPDPVGSVGYANRLAGSGGGGAEGSEEERDGLDLYRVSCPIGVLGIIFEARPEAAVQIATLAIKSGNALLLKGGKEAARSNRVLVEVMRGAILGLDDPFPPGAVQLLESREDVAAMLRLDEHIDLVIPRGSNALVSYIKRNTTIPVLGHADGICSVYLDGSLADADASSSGFHCTPRKAAEIVFESKTHYPAACNAVETILVHRRLLGDEAWCTGFFGTLADKFAAHGKPMEFRCDAETLPAFEAGLGTTCDVVSVKPSTPSDYREEYLRLCAAVAAVDSVDAAIAHINTHGSGHTDAIVGNDDAARERFFRGVDSADVFANASTRFSDGFRFGFGAEIGISTNRIHARGPVGLEGLVTYKYRLYGRGHLVAELGKKGGDDGAAAAGRRWIHEDLGEFKGPRVRKRVDDLEEEYAGAKRAKKE